MEEWRKGWHPERMNAKGKSSSVLVVGAGPAGLEAALASAKRGYDVAIAEASTFLGGRVALERKLPGLSAWGRVSDYREYQISQRPNVETYFDSELDAKSILEFGFENICIATGSQWRRGWVSRQHVVPFPTDPAMALYTPDDVMNGAYPTGHVVIYDDDHYYMGCFGRTIDPKGCQVTLVTPAAYVSEWTVNTLEQHEIHRRLASLGVVIELNRGIMEIGEHHVKSNCVFLQMHCDPLSVMQY